ncbi:MAG TPA: hypothetical protein VFW52_00515 [Candidatus Saccharimonadales bacterium]|nr:hypothetical protein [Candidatus Saccharimonadales bacterium]
MAKPRILLVVPNDDLSIKLFLADVCKAMMDVSVRQYQQLSDVVAEQWDFIYIRGPFIQADFNSPEIQESINEVLRNGKNAYVVDGIGRYSDLLVEDKWRQYGLLGEIMPATRLPKSFEKLDTAGKIIKKRISGRSRDIHFDITSLPENALPADYIIQDRLNIQTEYRVFMVGSKVILPLEIKSNKTETTKNKVIGQHMNLPDEISKICQEVFEKLRLDFAGLDIAKTANGYYLIEVNRSPQFVNFNRLSSINLAGQLFSYLLAKH